MNLEEPSSYEIELSKLSVEQALDKAIKAQIRIIAAKKELELLVKAHYYDLSQYWLNINKHHESSKYEYKHLRNKLDTFASLNIDLLKK
jgi:hypothetical protein